VSERLRRLAAPVLVGALCAYALFVFADTALRKQFWKDEGFEVAYVCERPAAAMLVQGSFGCSPAPLFSIVNRWVVRSVEPLGLPIRITYRSVSLAAATLALLAMLWGLGTRLGLPAGLLAYAALVADAGFHHYAEQNRAYVSWAMATAVLLLATAEACAREELRLRTRVGMLAAAGLLTGLCATPGAGQAATAFAAFWVFTRATTGAYPGRRATWALALCGVGILALDVHYWYGSMCRGWGGADALGLDLASGRDRWSQMKNGLSPLWPPVDAAWGYLLRAAFATGLLAPAFWWRRRRQLPRQDRYAAALWAASLAQLAVILPVALSLLASRYLFLPRMFIFALVPRAALTGLGFWIAARALRKALAGRLAARATDAVVWGTAAAVTAGALVAAHRIGSVWQFPLAPLGSISCADLKASPLRLFEPKDTPDEVTLNFLVRLGRAFDSCAATPVQPGPPRDLLAIDATVQPDWFRVVPSAPSGFEPLVVCGEAVTLRSGRFRGD
jgi:hypothetical protein